MRSPRLKFAYIVTLALYVGCKTPHQRFVDLSAPDAAPLVQADDVARALRSDSAPKLYKRSDPDQESLSYLYEADNGNMLTVVLFFKNGKNFFDLQILGKDDPARYGTKEPCEGIGDSCYRANKLLLVVLKGNVCFTVSIETLGKLSAIDLDARDKLAKNLAPRL